MSLPAQAAEGEATLYRRALDAVLAGQPQQAEGLIVRGHDAILSKVITGYTMSLPGNDYSFEQLDHFIKSSPGWPGLRGIQMIAEQKIPALMPPEQIVNWFSDHPPITLIGFTRYIDALRQSGQNDAAVAAICARWVNGEFSGDDITAFYNRYGAFLDGTAMWNRMDRLLWKGDEANARSMMPYISAASQSVAQARLALSTMDSNAPMWLARVPLASLGDPGLQFQKLRWLIKHNQDTEADELLLNPPLDLVKPDAWWQQRQIMIRRALEKHDFNLAYSLTRDHGQSDPKDLVQAEFLSGWIALRFLGQSESARQHFQNLYEKATTPVSKARGAYWLGRSYEAASDPNDAKEAYQDAATYSTTYYGQLSLIKLEEAPSLTVKSDPPLPESARKNFMGREIIRATLRLNDIGATDQARTFFHAAVEATKERGEFIILTELATHMHRPDLAIQAIKAAHQKNIMIENGGFPLLTVHFPTPPEPAFTHALIRQESLFNPEAESTVGARGLMQLMPRTAKETAKHLGLRYKESSLAEADYNLKLGTAFVQQQIDHFNGSYILALAGYNAGPGRVREWISIYGDPRSPDVDPIDWIELIPVQETRNYVQRILENIQVYRARLNNGQAPLQIMKDLKR